MKICVKYVEIMSTVKSVCVMTRKYIICNLLVTALVTALLLIVSGNVELNPGPMKKCLKCENLMPTRFNNCKCGYRALSLRHNNYVTFSAGVRICIEFKSMNMEKLSAYAQNLPQEAKQRYFEKISIIENIDPFNLFQEPVSSVLPVHQCNLPLVDASDLVSYLVLQTSYVTLK